MQLLVVRHGIAVPRGTPGLPDAERSLTEKGRRRFQEAAAGLARILRAPDAILTSPWKRALETAEIASRAWGGPEVRKSGALTGGSLEDLAGHLRDFPRESTVVLVGHEPWLSDLVGHLVGAGTGAGIRFKKGGAALVQVDGDLEEGGLLLWHLPPRILRALAGA